MTFGQRFWAVTKENGGVAKIAAALGCANSTMYTWFHGPSTPPIEAALQFCRLTGTDITWLVLGHGERNGLPTPSRLITPDWLRRLESCLDDIPMTGTQRDHVRMLLAEARGGPTAPVDAAPIAEPTPAPATPPRRKPWAKLFRRRG